MRLFDALAAAGSTLPTAGAEAVIVPVDTIIVPRRFFF